MTGVQTCALPISFTAKKREARTGRNPQTGEAVKIAARTVPGFKAGNKLKDALN